MTEKKTPKKCKHIMRHIVGIIALVLIGAIAYGTFMNMQKLDQIQDLYNTKSERFCENSSQEIMKNIIENEKKVGQIIVEDKEAALMELRVKCLYSQGYSIEAQEEKKEEDGEVK